MPSNRRFKSNEASAGSSVATPRTAWRTSAMSLTLSCLIGFATNANAQTPQSAPLTADEQRKVLASLVECEGLASEYTILAVEAELLREARDAQARAAVLFEASASEERKARLAQEALTEQAREETKAERKKGRWNLLKGIGIGAVVGGSLVALAAVLGGR